MLGSMLGAVPAACYRKFHRWLGRTGLGHGHQEPQKPDDSFRRGFGPDASFGEVDRIATRLGEVYRGTGVLCGVIGWLVVLLALSPDVFHLPPGSGARLTIKTIEFSCIVVVGLMVWAARRKDMKRRWILTRIYAEELRYAPLAAHIAGAQRGEEAAWQSLRAEISRLLAPSGDASQLAYHQAKSEQYQGVEWLATRVTWWFYFGSFVTAAFATGHAVYELLNDHPMHDTSKSANWTLLLLVGFPATVTVLHGLVAFLRLPQLVSQHDLAVRELTALRLRMLDLEKESGPLEHWVRLAQDLLAVLTRGDTAWVGIAHHQELIPA